jgi:hypothetical protein
MSASRRRNCWPTRKPIRPSRSSATPNAPDVIAVCDYSGSTAGMINYVKDTRPPRVLLVTECSMASNIQSEVEGVEFIKPCNLCPHMKRITLPKILDSLLMMTEEVPSTRRLPTVPVGCRADDQSEELDVLARRGRLRLQASREPAMASTADCYSSAASRSGDRTM